MMRYLSILGLLLLSALPSVVFALGLGDIRLDSSLNEPLRAEIELVSASAEELISLEAELASTDTFERYGLEYPSFLSGVLLTVTKDASGRSVLRVTSQQSITEPFVTFLVEVNWARGRLLREYTVLLDPPLYMPSEQTGASAPVAAPRGADTESTVRQPAPSPAAAPPSPRPVAPSSAVAEAPTPAPEPAPVSRPPVPMADEYSVVRNDTLWNIAERFRPAGVGMNQMMIAVYRANPNAFLGNINRLKAGVILRIPEMDEILSTDQSAALAEVQQHNADWRGGDVEAGTLRLIAADDTESVQFGDTAAGPTVAELAEKDAQIEVLESQVEELEYELGEANRLMELQDRELAVLQQELTEQQAMAEAEAGQLLDEEPPGGEQLFVEEEVIEDLFVEEEEELGAEAVQPDEFMVGDTGAGPEPTGTEPETTVPPGTAPTTTEPVPSAPTASPVERVLGHLGDHATAYSIGLGGILLLLAAVMYLRRRGEDEDLTGTWEAMSSDQADLADETLSSTESLKKIPRAEDSIVVVEAEETGIHTIPGLEEEEEGTVQVQAVSVEDTTVEDTQSNETLIGLESSDPLAEADFHMAYGLYDQAADLVKLAIDRHPERRDLKLKLVEIFFVWGNKEAFIETARELHDTQDEAAAGEWDKILIMGKQICPEDQLFSGEPGVAVQGDVDVQLEGGPASGVDLAVGGEPQQAGGGIDFDLGDALGAEEEISDDTSETGEAAALSEDSGEFLIDEDTREQSAITQEFPVESPTGMAHTMETPTIETPAAEDSEGATVEAPAPKDAHAAGDSPTVKQQIDAAIFNQESSTEQTAELELDDLGLDLDELQATAERPALESDSAGETGVTRTMETPGPAGTSAGTGTVVLDDRKGLGDIDTDATVRVDLTEDEIDLGDTAEREGLDLDLAAMDDQSGSQTVDEKQSADDQFSADVFSSGEDTLIRQVDIDVGSQAETGETGVTRTQEMLSAEPALGGDADFTRTEQIPASELPDVEPVTMSEVGTKLDLARAYMDMGDPDGARSILQEVLEEGTEAQRQDAQKLMNALP